MRSEFVESYNVLESYLSGTRGKQAEQEQLQEYKIQRKNSNLLNDFADFAKSKG